MSTGESRGPADKAINDFIRYLANRDFSITTQRIRRHFLDEYLQHVRQAADTVDVSAGDATWRRTARRRVSLLTGRRRRRAKLCPGRPPNARPR